MSRSVLVAYASRAGSTAGVAAAIAETLSAAGIDADLKPVQAVDNLQRYDAVIAGSAIQIDRWLPEAMDFMRRHQTELARKPFAAFLVCLAMSATEPRRLARSRQQASGWMQPVRDLVTPVSEGLFPGALDLSKIPFGYRLLFRIPITLGLWAEGDYRDWDAVRAWAAGLPAQLIK